MTASPQLFVVHARLGDDRFELSRGELLILGSVAVGQYQILHRSLRSGCSFQNAHSNNMSMGASTSRSAGPTIDKNLEEIQRMAVVGRADCGTCVASNTSG